MIPEPVTSPEMDLGRRTQSIGDLEATLVKFIQKLFIDTHRLDNPTLNLAQPDTVSYDYVERAQTLEQKVPPRVVRGRVPRTVTGEIAVDRLPDIPSIIVQALGAKVLNDQTEVSVRILINAYDEDPNSGGYQDCQNMAETIGLALTSWGQKAIDDAYPIIMPLEWKLLDQDTFPHYIVEMTTLWQLPSARPFPDSETFGIVPAEHIDLRANYDNEAPLAELMKEGR